MSSILSVLCIGAGILAIIAILVAVFIPRKTSYQAKGIYNPKTRPWVYYPRPNDVFKQLEPLDGTDSAKQAEQDYKERKRKGWA